MESSVLNFNRVKIKLVCFTVGPNVLIGVCDMKMIIRGHLANLDDSSMLL